jgi:glutamate-1-semialdehyde 2,1-aminomutase
MNNTLDFSRSRELQAKSHRLIPGGAHTYAKGDDQYPEQAPGFVARGQGCHVWDVDGNEFIEYGMGLRSVTLGHGFAPIVEAVARQLECGANFTRPAAIEVECAERLLHLIQNAEMAKFAKNGSDVTTAAIKLARAYTGRDLVAICGDQPFFSVDDWFIGTTAMSAGIPEAAKRLTVKFRYNDLDSVRALFASYPGQVAGLIMEAETTVAPAGDFLCQVQALCRQAGALFILDEIITGFRWHLGGAQAVYGLEPDLTTFAKGMGNGFSVSALVGKRDIMGLGGLQHQRERVFLLSNTYGAETHSLAAAIATMQFYETHDVIGCLARQGERLRAGVQQVVAAHRLENYFGVRGRACNLVFYTNDPDQKPSQAFRTLFMQEMIKAGVLAPSFVVSFSHSDEDIDRTIAAVDGALEIYRRAMDDGIERYLLGRAVKPVMRAHN